jgi:serine/threonine-protein kinase
VAIAIKHTLEEPPSLSQFNPTIAPSVEAVIMKAIAKKPEQRYASAGELAQALRTVIGELDPTHSILSPQESANGRLMPVTLMNNDTAPDVSTTPDINEDMHAGLTEAATPVVPTHTPVSIQSLPTAMLQAGPTQTPSPQPVHPVQSTPAQLIQASPHSPYSQQHHKGQSMRIAILGILLILVLIVGGLAAYLHATNEVHSSPQTPLKVLATHTPTLHRSLTPLPHALVPVGSLLYGTNSPGARCDTQGGKWSSTSNAMLTCDSSKAGTELTNTGGSNFAAMTLDQLPNGQSLPNDYVIQVQTDLNAHSHGRFRILYRIQPDQPLNAYFFTIDPNGSWQFGAYDNGEHQLAGNSIIGGKLTNIITIDVMVQGGAFTLYVNGGIAQGHGSSSHYSSGTVGLAVDADTSVTFKNLAIYSL